MKPCNTQQRLRLLMSEKSLRQVDILNLLHPYCEKYNVKFNKSDISQYLSGKNEPHQDKLAILALALNVNEAWLMGFDVPRERQMPKPTSNSIPQIKPGLVEKIAKLDDIDQARIEERVDMMLEADKYSVEEGLSCGKAG
mgnify:CR=1 FL=1